MLNPAQNDAVSTIKGPLLVLAGAGSGKTRILTHRIVQIIESGNALPGEILAVTFTNKAAKEMLSRVEKLLHRLDIPANDLWISTFHSTGVRILREFGHLIGLKPGFSIYDSTDQIALVKLIFKRLEISDKVVSPQSVIHKIEQIKNEGESPLNFKATGFFERKIEPILRAYEEGLRAANALDFGDLLLKVYELFSKHPDVLDHYQERFRFILVDEYQDTNLVQYKTLKLLASKYRNLCVVGDEDQSIYKWRGADIRNILDFEKDFPEAKVVKLEENYRSTKHIIRAASHIIRNNKQRKDKTLFTNNEDGDQVEVHILENDFAEARFVARKVKELIAEGASPKDVAVFYRTNAQSRLLEESFRYDRIPFKVFGGMKFYDRAEVKDALAYLRLMNNPNCDVSTLRIVNVPARGIGDTTLDKIKELAKNEKIPMMEALGLAARPENEILNAGTKKKIKGFLELMAKLTEQSRVMSPAEFYASWLEESGYRKLLEDENTVESEGRLENLRELGSALTEYEARSETPSLFGFLEEVALISDLDKANAADIYVTMMTMHSAKGLEFPYAFIVGMEEELFPSARSIQEGDGDSEGVEEERRLCYVGMTRAEKKLWMTAAHTRKIFGVQHVRQLSRFIDELPAGEYILKDHAPVVTGFARTHHVSAASSNGFGDYGDPFGGAFEAPTSSFMSAPANDGYDVGKKVKHPDYGIGKVLGREGSGDSLKVRVQFERFGVKKFVIKYAPLEVLP